MWGPSLPYVMTKLNRDKDLVDLIWASKVSYLKGFIDAWDSQNWTRSSSKKKCEKNKFYL
jgi:hypothetical protein